MAGAVCMALSARDVAISTMFGGLGQFGLVLFKALSRRGFKNDQISSRHYQQYIPISVLGISATDYPALSLKAWTNRIVTSVLNACMQDACSRFETTERFVLAASACQKLDEWQLCVELGKRYLGQAEANHMWNLSMECLWHEIQSDFVWFSLLSH